MIIGLSSKMGCGKTTLANILLQELNGYKRKAFADVLKKECSEIYKYPLEWNYSEEGKLKNISLLNYNTPKISMTVREILQWHGTDLRRKQDYDYWVKAMNSQIEDNDNVIIDDVRFPNEADFVVSRNGMLVRIQPYPGWVPEKYSDHISETALDDYTNWSLVLNPEYGELKKCVYLIKDLLLNYNRYIKDILNA